MKQCHDFSKYCVVSILNRLSIYIDRYIIVLKQQSSFTETLSGTFHKWKYADWFYDLSVKDKDKQFHLFFGNGTLEVKQPGLYLLYSQITLKGNGTQGYHVMRNDKDPILACYSNNMMLHEEDKTSCFTMGMFKLDKKDTISVKHISTSGVRAVFTSNASFFGLVRLGRFNKRGVVLAV